MKKSKFRKFLITALITLLILATMLFTFSSTQGQVEVQTYPYLVVTPNPVAIGQKVFIVMWIHGAPPTASGLGGDRYSFTLEVKKPNENNFNFIYPDANNPVNQFFISDETGSTFTQYIPESEGEYEFRLTYTGQIISRFNPETGIPGFPEPLANIPNLVNSEFLPSETIKKLTVKNEQLLDPTITYPLPDEYWTRPIEGQNTEWATISSNWLAGAHTQDLFQRDGTAPSSPHIMWTKPIEFGGIVGGTTEIPGLGFYSGGSYEGRFTNPISMFGRLYYQVPLHHAGGAGSSASGYACVDLRTGETIWVSDEIGIPYKGVFGIDQGPTIKGQLYDYETVNQHGVVGGLIWTEDGSTWKAYDAFTGQWVYSLTNVPAGTEVYTKSGEIERYVLDYPNRELTLWTSSAIPTSPLVAEADINIGPSVPGTTESAFAYRPMGKNADMSDNIIWSVTIPNLPGDGNPTIIKVLPDDLILGTSTNFPYAPGISRIPPSVITMWAINLDVNRDANKDGVADENDIGTVLWIYDIPCTEDPENPGNYLTRTLGPVYVGLDKDKADTIRIFTMSDAQNFTWFGYNLDDPANPLTGQPEPIWGPVYDDDYLSDYQYYGIEGGGQTGYVAYGRLYVCGYGGEIHCFDLEDGKLLWEYSTSEKKDLHPEDLECETNSVWGYFPIFIAGIADDKIYVYNNEHSPNNPYYKGERVRCLNAKYDPDVPSDKLEIWTLMGMAGQSINTRSNLIIADGFLCYYNYYDNSIYCIGKGPTKTTVTAPDIEVPKGSSVLIQGSVIDISPGTLQDEQTKRFPHGVPAVSDESIGPWMENLYMQKPYSEEITGVEVTLEVVDPNNDRYQIGTVESEPSGIYAYDFAPSDPGLYKIIATFQGSDSYWPSVAETFILVEGKTKQKTSNVNALLGDSLTVNSVAIIGLLCSIIIGGVLLVYKSKKFVHYSK
ncbi:MAG: hypothetical protein AC479_07525 [miscellaneous Crenarchaeota group-6 archaeon AD8-1]|nr:MAG: hypothetical protein AC479_07525 [miscellaneous Crenarchaeota group-6 archaeon AD8-1]